MTIVGPDRPRSLFVALLAIALLLGLVTPRPATAQSTPEASPAATPGGVVTLPETPVGGQLAWLLEQMNGDPTALTDEVLGERFNEAFLAQVPPDQIRDLLGQLAADGPWSLVSIVGEPSDLQMRAIIRGQSEALQVTASVESAPPHRFNGLFFQAPPAASWDEVDAGLNSLGPLVSLLAAEVTEAGCEPVHAVGTDQRLPIGSAFKLYVLGELARQVEAGEASWDEVLPIREEWKSLPSGDLAHAPAGTPHTLRYYAEVMISQSDNTATDHLIHRLGRENVEAITDSMGHREPSLNIPLLTTREFFVIKLALPVAERQAYLAAGSDERRAMLDGPIAALPLPTPEQQAGFTGPILIDQIEWFASGEDLCRAMAYLWTRSSVEGLLPVREVLSLNPGLPLDRSIWPIALFKGGSEPGVLNGTSLLVRNDGRVFVVTVGISNADGAVNENAAIGVAQNAAGLLAGLT
jgi:beta-lactamase class A